MKAMIPLPYYSAKHRKTAMTTFQISLQEVHESQAPVAATWREEKGWGEVKDHEFRVFEGRLLHLVVPKAADYLEPDRVAARIYSGGALRVGDPETRRNAQYHPLVPAICKRLSETQTPFNPPVDETDNGYQEASEAARRTAARSFMIGEDLWQETPGPVLVVGSYRQDRMRILDWAIGDGQEHAFSRMAWYRADHIDQALQDLGRLNGEEITVRGQAPRIYKAEALNYDDDGQAVQAGTWCALWCVTRENLPNVSRKVLEATYEMRRALISKWPGLTEADIIGNRLGWPCVDLDRPDAPNPGDLVSILHEITEALPADLQRPSKILDLVRIRAERVFTPVLDMDHNALAGF